MFTLAYFYQCLKSKHRWSKICNTKESITLVSPNEPRNLQNNLLLNQILFTHCTNFPFYPTLYGWVVWPWCFWLGKNFWPLTISIVPCEGALFEVEVVDDSIYTPFIINLCSKISQNPNLVLLEMSLIYFLRKEQRLWFFFCKIKT